MDNYEENSNITPGTGYPAAHDFDAQNAAEQAPPVKQEQPAATPGQPEGTPGNYWESWQGATQNAAHNAAWTNPDSTAHPAADAGGWGSQGTYGAESQTPAGASAPQSAPGWGNADAGWNAWNSQDNQKADPAWQPYGDGQQDPATHQYVYTPAKEAAQPPKAERKKRKAPRVVAMLLACSLLGFGGGMLANYFSGNANANQTVVYRTPEGDNTSTTNTGDGLSLSEVAAIAKASVVAIETENVVQDYSIMGGQVVSGAGSGVIISEDGTIITNHHVVEGARNIIVRTEDGTEYEAQVLGSDQRSDIAVLKIEATGLTPAVIGDSDSLQVGEYCLAVGNPTGALEGTVTDGIISAVNRTVTIDGNTMTLLQMSAAVSPGNSGGGLFNTNGELIGIVNAKSDGDSVEGLGFAIPVNDAIAVAEELITNGVITRPGLGVTIADLTNERDAAAAGVETPGVYINSISAGSAAERAGLQVGDRVVSVDGEAVTSYNSISDAIAAKNVGDTLTLVVERNGQQIEVEAVLGVLES